MLIEQVELLWWPERKTKERQSKQNRSINGKSLALELVQLHNLPAGAIMAMLTGATLNTLSNVFFFTNLEH